MSATTDRESSWQSVSCPDNLKACGCVRDGFYILGPLNQVVARYEPELGLASVLDALERYRTEQEKAQA
jgi:hypothetical protein